MRTARRLVTVMGGGQTYEQRVLALSPYAYWPLNEAAGATTALDLVGGYNSTALSGVTFGAAGIGDGNTAATFDGDSATGITLPHATLTSVFAKNEGSLVMWLKTDAAALTDGVRRYIMYFFGSTAGGQMIPAKETTNNTAFYHRSGSNVSIKEYFTQASSDWICFAQTWSVSGNALKGFVNGAQVGSTQANIQAWTASPVLANVYLGRGGSVGAAWKGGIAHFALFSRVLTTDELLALASF